MSIWSSIIGGGASAIMDSAKGVIGMFTTDKVVDSKQAHTIDLERLKATHSETMASIGIDQTALEGAQAMAVAEWQASAGKTGPLNAFVDFINRLPRPLMALGVIAMFAYNFYDPVSAQAAFQTLDYVPLELWSILGGIMAFYFGAREIAKSREQKNKPNPNRIMEIASTMTQMKKDVAAAKQLEEEAKISGAIGSSEGNATIQSWLKERLDP